jgi:hypothetical protein
LSRPPFAFFSLYSCTSTDAVACCYIYFWDLERRRRRFLATFLLKLNANHSLNMLSDMPVGQAYPGLRVDTQSRISSTLWAFYNFLLPLSTVYLPIAAGIVSTQAIYTRIGPVYIVLLISIRIVRVMPFGAGLLKPRPTLRLGRCLASSHPLAIVAFTTQEFMHHNT